MTTTIISKLRIVKNTDDGYCYLSPQYKLQIADGVKTSFWRKPRTTWVDIAFDDDIGKLEKNSVDHATSYVLRQVEYRRQVQELLKSEARLPINLEVTVRIDDEQENNPTST